MQSAAGGRQFHYEAGLVHRVAGHGTTLLVLPVAPVVSVASVKLVDLDGTALYTFTVNDEFKIEDAEAGILFNRYGWAWSASMGAGIGGARVAGSEQYEIEVTYTAGWVTPEQDALNGPLTRDLPEEIEEVVIETVASGYQRGAARDPDIISQATANQSTSWASPGSAGVMERGILSPSALAVARSYYRAVSHG